MEMVNTLYTIKNKSKNDINNNNADKSDEKLAEN